MINELLNVLKVYDGLEYKIMEEKTSRVESYYIRKELEMNRAVDVTHTYLTVYKVFEEDGKRFRGASQTEIHPGMQDAEIRAAVDETLYAAGFVKNEYFPLVEPSAPAENRQTSDIADIGLDAALERLSAAVFAEDRHDKGYLSATEFYVSKTDVRTVNSLGVDISYTRYAVMAEACVNWADGKEIEITESYTLAGCDTAGLGNRVKKLFEVAAKKPSAAMTPVVTDTNILLTGECLSDFFRYYAINANAGNIYNRISTYKAGDDIQGNITGDSLNITLDPFLSGSSASRAYDADGFPLKKVELIKDGKLMCLCGDVRHSSYLNIPPTGSIRNLVVGGGSMSVEDMKKQPYLELVSFSGFGVDPITGDFASEIRLGFYYDGKTTVPVTGGSISGNIKKVHSQMRLSKETVQYNDYKGPATICLRNVSIAGK